jgi:UDP-2,3-diacylglucosamine pyrophosphatase LpxH
MKKLDIKDGLAGRPIRLNKCHLLPKGDNDYSEVMFLGDLHLGSPQCDKQRFMDNIAFCLRHGIYIMLMGDMVEAATRHSVGAGVYEQENPCQSQHEQLVEWLRPLAEKKLILGALQGNHSERIYKESGVNIVKAFCRELRVPYLGDACWSAFHVGNETYSVYSLHGRSNARFDGTALLAVERISTSFFADLVAHAHMHKCVSSIVVMQKTKNGLVTEHKKHLLITGGYLRYDNSYGAAMGLPISKLGSPKVRFYGFRHELTIHW